MTSPSLPISDLGDLLKLPDSACTRDGVDFDPKQGRWAYREALMTVSLDFDNQIKSFAPELLLPSKLALLWYARNKSANHLKNMFERLSHFLEFRKSCVDVIGEISVNDVLNYKASLKLPERWYLTSLAGFLRKWHRLGYPGVNEEVVRLLDSFTLPGNQKGAAVLTLDPLLGPFSDIEVEALQEAVDTGYAKGKLDESEYFLARLFLALGSRPEQFASLKVCDMRRESTEQGDYAYFLNLPRAKQRGQRSRTEFKSRPLIPQIGAPLFEYSQRIGRQYSTLLDDYDQAPLFPQKRETEWAEGFRYHQTAKSLGISLAASLTKLGVVSERTGEEMNIAPIRFRRTLGTRAAQEGHGELVIAELLDHSDTQNVGVYVAATPEIAQRIDRAVAMTMAPLAQAFKGIIIFDESQATRREDASSRIVDLRIDQSAAPIGSCGQHSFCGFLAPIACYTCSNFEPWLDGPHEAVLSHLIDYRERLLETTDERIAAVNDRTIYAVAEVIQLCAERKATTGI